jgi:hypothetical protein
MSVFVYRGTGEYQSIPVGVAVNKKLEEVVWKESQHVKGSVVTVSLSLTLSRLQLVLSATKTTLSRALQVKP